MKLTMLAVFAAAACTSNGPEVGVSLESSPNHWISRACHVFDGSIGGAGLGIGSLDVSVDGGGDQVVIDITNGGVLVAHRVITKEDAEAAGDRLSLEQYPAIADNRSYTVVVTIGSCVTD